MIDQFPTQRSIAGKLTFSIRQLPFERLQILKIPLCQGANRLICENTCAFSLLNDRKNSLRLVSCMHRISVLTRIIPLVIHDLWAVNIELKHLESNQAIRRSFGF